MGKQNDTFAGWAKLGYVSVGGKLVKAETLVAKVKQSEKIIPGANIDKQVSDMIHTLVPEAEPESIPFLGKDWLEHTPPVKGNIPNDFKGCYTIHLKPMSVNEAWKGRRYRSDKYNAYKRAVGLMLPNIVAIPEGLLKVYYEFGLSSSGGDWDNPVKPIQDILQEQYRFNDSRIMEATVKKVIVAKGSEYIRFKIESL